MKAARTVEDIIKDLDALFLLIIEEPVMSDNFDRMIKKRNELMIELDHCKNPVHAQTQIRTIKLQRHETKTTYDT